MSKIQTYVCKSTPMWIDKSKNIHGARYDYTLANPKNIHDKTTIICKKHGNFLKTFANHITRSSGCPKCKYETDSVNNRSMTTEEFIDRCSKVHNSRYDYTKTVYTGRHKYCIVTCKEHGDFSVRANNHLACKSRCPRCVTSFGEDRITDWLRLNCIEFVSEYKFENCKLKRKLSFDFYLPKQNTCIEYDGIQHTINTFGMNETDYNLLKLRDKIKTEYCHDNNIRLLRINYTDFNQIEDILESEIQS